MSGPGKLSVEPGSESVSAVFVGGDPVLVEGIDESLGVSTLHISADDVMSSGNILDHRINTGGFVWVHVVPSGIIRTSAVAEDADFGEASLLARSVSAARATADRTGVPLTFVAILPTPGLLTSSLGQSCDLALSTMESLMRTEIGRWGNANYRIVAIEHSGLEGYIPDGQRPLDQILERTPMKVLGTFAQLGDALRYVGSRRASYVTGTFLRVDGGWNAYSWMYPARTI